MSWYPLANGMGTVGNHWLVRRIAGDLPQHCWARVGRGQAILVPTGDYVGRALTLSGDLDRKISRTFERFARSGDLLLDIGANLGLHTLQASRIAGPSGRVLSFEPNPNMTALLRQSLEKNDCRNVTLHQCGLGSEETTLDLHVPLDHAGRGSLLEPNSKQDPLTRISVPVKTLDSLLAGEGSRVGLVKMDVEGFESEVLRGAAELLSNSPPHGWIFESHNLSKGLRSEPSAAILLEAGYRLFFIVGRGMRVSQLPADEHSPPPSGCHDILAIHQDSERLGSLMHS